MKAGKHDAQARKMFDDMRVEAEERLERPVIAACLCSRRGLMTNKTAGRFGAIPYLLSRKAHAVQSGGLPQTFLLVVTKRRVHVLAVKTLSGHVRAIGDELAVWNRDELTVETGKGGPYQVGLTLISKADGERVACAIGDTAPGREFIALLQSPA